MKLYKSCGTTGPTMFVAPDRICQPMKCSEGLSRQTLWDLWYYCYTGKGTLCHGTEDIYISDHKIKVAKVGWRCGGWLTERYIQSQLLQHGQPASTDISEMVISVFPPGTSSSVVTGSHSVCLTGPLQFCCDVTIIDIFTYYCIFEWQ